MLKKKEALIGAAVVLTSNMNRAPRFQSLWMQTCPFMLVHVCHCVQLFYDATLKPFSWFEGFDWQLNITSETLPCDLCSRYDDSGMV